jgi:hypothetical protein
MNGACNEPAKDKIVGHNFSQRNSGNLVVYERIILKWVSKEQGSKKRAGFIWLRIRSTVGSCEHGNESSCSVIGYGFLTN